MQKPISEQQLFAHASSLAGASMQQLASKNNQTVPSSLLHAKGWVGQLLELELGAMAGNLDMPDFVDLGIELKTLPIGNNNMPTESTFICSTPIPNPDRSWEQSRVYRKTAKILWIPYQADKNIPISQRKIGMPLLWSAPKSMQQQLKQDWQELTELLNLGNFDALSARQGTYLQIRPKALNSKTQISVINHLGQKITTVPKGFYFRAKLTREIIDQYYC